MQPIICDGRRYRLVTERDKWPSVRA